MLVAVFLAGSVYQVQAVELALLDLYSGEEDMILLATGTPMPVSKAPSVATVITAKQIRAMGAQDIDQVLETVPGLHVSRYYQTNGPVFVFRGAYTVANPQVLVMINGIRINALFSGNMHNIWGGMPVEAISRIEVVRGPGSAVYGADAFSGVINIVTKTADELGESEIGLRGGSFDTQDAWLAHGGEWAGVKTAFIMEYHQTDGFEAQIAADAQTALDMATGTNASYAPGNAIMSRDNLDMRLDTQKGEWQWRLGMQQRNNVGLHAGVAQALAPATRYASERWNSDLTWRDEHFTESLDLQIQLSAYSASQELYGGSVLTIFPPGSAPFGDVTGDGNPDSLPDGLIGNPEFWERQYSFEVTALYTGIDRHEVRVGAGRHFSELHRTRETKNFGVNPATGQETLPLTADSPLFDVSDTPYIYQPERGRANVHAYIQDVWDFAADWHLTAGVRHDQYSDVGSTTNPRIALVWWTDYDLTTKLLYGRAFRSPSFVEMYIQANPVVRGNPNLKPETIATTELAFDYRPTGDLILDLNFFHYDWNDKIESYLDVGSGLQQAQNIGRQSGRGMEFAVEWQVQRNLSVLGNYAYQVSDDLRLAHDAGNAPHQQIYVRSDWSFLPAWHWNVQVNRVGERERQVADERAAVPAYTTVDTKLAVMPGAANWELALIAYNLFDSRLLEPSLNGEPVPAVPGDLPQGGRSVFVETRYKF